MKRSNAIKLLQPIAQRMVDYPVDMRCLQLEFSIWGGPGILGCVKAERIKVYACSCAWNLHVKHRNPHDVMTLGTSVTRVLAHEFRHCQQEALSWDYDIPQVRQEAKRFDDGSMMPGATLDQYNDDPGEQDAEAFADKVMTYIPRAYIRKIGRLARWACYHQFESWMAYAQP